jgi:hypothetical protein
MMAINKTNSFRRKMKFLFNSKTLILGTLLIGCVFLFGGFFILNRYYDGIVPEKAQNICGAISLIWFMASSIFVIINRELPRTGGLPSFQGWFAVAVGVLGLILTTIAETLLIILIIKA